MYPATPLTAISLNTFSSLQQAHFAHRLHKGSWLSVAHTTRKTEPSNTHIIALQLLQCSIVLPSLFLFHFFSSSFPILPAAKEAGRTCKRKSSSLESQRQNTVHRLSCIASPSQLHLNQPPDNCEGVESTSLATHQKRVDGMHHRLSTSLSTLSMEGAKSGAGALPVLHHMCTAKCLLVEHTSAACQLRHVSLSTSTTQVTAGFQRTMTFLNNGKERYKCTSHPAVNPLSVVASNNPSSSVVNSFSCHHHMCFL